MFRYVIIASNTGFVSFSHYFEAIPDQLKLNLEKEAVEACISKGEKEGRLQVVDSVVAFRREGILLIIVGAKHGTNHCNVLDLLHSFSNILTHHLHALTEKSVIHRKNLIHKILEQMVHGNVLETRITHIPALEDLKE